MTDEQLEELDVFFERRQKFDKELAEISPKNVICDVQQIRMKRYEALIHMASCKEERKALYQAYEISRLIHIKHEDVVERSSWLLKTIDDLEYEKDK